MGSKECSCRVLGSGVLHTLSLSSPERAMALYFVEHIEDTWMSIWVFVLCSCFLCDIGVKSLLQCNTYHEVCEHTWKHRMSAIHTMNILHNIHCNVSIDHTIEERQMAKYIKRQDCVIRQIIW